MATVAEAADRVLRDLLRASYPPTFLEVEVARLENGRWPTSDRLVATIREQATEKEREGRRLRDGLDVALKGWTKDKDAVVYVVRC